MLFATSFMELGHHQTLDHIKPCKPLNGTPIITEYLSVLANFFKTVKVFDVFFLKDRKTIEVT